METTFDRYPKVRDEFIKNWQLPFKEGFPLMSAMAVLLLPTAMQEGNIEPALADEMGFLIDLYFESHKEDLKKQVRLGVNKTLGRA